MQVQAAKKEKENAATSAPAGGPVLFKGLLAYAGCELADSDQVARDSCCLCHFFHLDPDSWFSTDERPRVIETKSVPGASGQ